MRSISKRISPADVCCFAWGDSTIRCAVQMCIRDRRIIVDDPYKTACLLKESGYVFSITPVLAVAIPDEPGSLLQVLRLMKEGGINVEYTYAFITRRQDCAYMIFRVEDNDKAVDILTRHDVRLLSQEEPVSYTHLMPVWPSSMAFPARLPKRPSAF